MCVPQVFTACGCAPLVRNAEPLLELATRTLGPTLVATVVRPTFFRHFCVGEDVAGIAPVLDRLRAAGIGGILDYAAEADLAADASGNAAADAASSAAAHSPGLITFETHGVSSPPVHSARVYHYMNERECDANAAIFKDAIEAVRDVSPDGFAAIKMTALGNPALLERWSTARAEIAALFGRIQADAAADATGPTCEFAGNLPLRVLSVAVFERLLVIACRHHGGWRERPGLAGVPAGLREPVQRAGRGGPAPGV